MPNLLKLKRGAAASIPQGALAEPLFTTDTYDLYIGKGAGGNQRIQNYIASGTSSQFLKGDGSLDSNTYQTALTFSSPLVNTSGTISIPAATGSVDGYLTSTDWTTFNSKEPAITASTTAKYWRGDKTFQTLDTSVVPENGPIYFTEPRVLATVLTGLNLTGGGTISASDSVLSAFGKVQNQISALVGGATYQGVWNASTNSPSLASGVGTKGFYYVVSVAGSTNLDGITDWKVGDWAIFNGTTWDKVDNTDAVSSVNGFTGAVNLGLGDISNVTLTSPTNNQLIKFDGTTSKWVNFTPAYEPTLTKGNLTEATSSVLTITGGTGAVIGSGTTIEVKSASATQNGVITTGTQTIAGAKTFSSDITVNGVKVGRGAGNDSSNTVVGYNTLGASSTSVAGNTAIGYGALYANTSGFGNTGIGFGALGTNTTGESNTSVGVDSGQLIIGSGNTFIGRQSFAGASSGSNNTIVGYQAGFQITSGSNNTIIGMYSGLISALSNNVILSDGSGNIRFQHNGTSGKLPFLTSNGFVKTSGSDGTLSIDTISYLSLAGGTLTGALTVSTSVAQTLTLDSTETNFTQMYFNKSGTNRGKLYLYYDGSSVYDMVLGTYTSTGRVRFETGNNTNALTLNADQSATFFGGISGTSASFSSTISASNFSGSSSGTNTGDQTTITGNAGSATVLQTARNFTINGTAKSFDGSAAVSWTAAEIGLTSYLPLSGGTLTGALSGTSATFSADIYLATSSGYVTIGSTTSGGVPLEVYNATAARINLHDNTNTWATLIDNASGEYRIRYASGAINPLRISTTGAATFSSSVTASGNLNLQGAVTRNINFYDSSNTNINAQIQYDQISSNSGQLFFGTNNAGTFATRLTISNTGAATFSIASGIYTAVNATSPNTSVYYKLTPTGGDAYYLGAGVNQTDDFSIYNVTRSKAYLTILGGASGGNVGIGITSPNAKLQINNGTDLNVAFNTTTVSGTTTSRISSFNDAVTATVGLAINGNPLVFQANGTEAMRITSGGFSRFTTNGTYSSATSQHEFNQATNTQFVTGFYNRGTSGALGIQIEYTGTDPNGTANQFINCQGQGTLRAEIRSNGGIANYSANDVNLSDIRVKEDIVSLDSYWNKFKQLDFVKFKYKDQTHEDYNIGLIAQQVEQIAPEFIDTDGWGITPKDGVPLKTIYTTDLYHAAMAVLKEALIRIEKLENKN